MYTKTQPLNDKCITKYELWCTIVKWGIIHIVYSFTELLFRSKTSLIKTERNHICGAVSASLQLINAPWYTRVTIENESKCEKKKERLNLLLKWAVTGLQLAATSNDLISENLVKKKEIITGIDQNSLSFNHTHVCLMVLPRSLLTQPLTESYIK